MSLVKLGSSESEPKLGFLIIFKESISLRSTVSPEESVPSVENLISNCLPPIFPATPLVFT